MPITSRLLSVCPRIRKRGRKLEAATAWRLRILTLGMFYRRVVIDTKKREIRLFRRYLWFFARQRRFRFGEIEAVTYGYTDSAWGQWTHWAHDSHDWFAVGIRLATGEEVHFFYFYGDGTFTNNGPWPDWLYWDDYLFDMSGTQERESRGFVELLMKMIGVTLVPPRH